MTGASPTSRAWTEADLRADPHARADKPERVRAMFGAIAGSYDLNNRLHSLWRDQAWRRFAVREAGVGPRDAVLDVACGTGDLALAFVAAGAGNVVGLDFTGEMLEIAGAKSARRGIGPERLRFIRGDAQELPLGDGSFDIVSIAFGIRNVQDPAMALREFRRVLRPGGRLVVLEFAEPRLGPVRWFNNLYCRRIMPVTATLISGDRSGAYRYLPRSIETFLTREQMCGMIGRSGFGQVTARGLSMGICVCYRAVAES